MSGVNEIKAKLSAHKNKLTRKYNVKLKCRHVSATEADDEIFQVEFEAVRGQEDGPYLLLQRTFLEEDEEDDDQCYVETNEEHLIGHYPKLDVELTRNRLLLYLPPPADETIEVSFQATDQEFQEVRRILAIILRQNVE